MASIPNLLPALTGALQGYSSARGLDLARKLREQAALDELDFTKFKRESEFKADLVRSEVGEERRRALIAGLIDVTAQAQGLGVSGALDTSKVLDNVDAFDENQLMQLHAGLQSAITAETGRRSDISTAQAASVSAAELASKLAKESSEIAENVAQAGEARAGAGLKVAQTGKTKQETENLKKSSGILEKPKTTFNKKKDGSVDFLAVLPDGTKMVQQMVPPGPTLGGQEKLTKEEEVLFNSSFGKIFEELSIRALTDDTYALRNASGAVIINEVTQRHIVDPAKVTAQAQIIAINTARQTLKSITAPPSSNAAPVEEDDSPLILTDEDRERLRGI